MCIYSVKIYVGSILCSYIESKSIFDHFELICGCAPERYNLGVRRNGTIFLSRPSYPPTPTSEKSDNFGLFAQFVKDSLQARQRRLRRVQAQCPDSIFIEAANFPKEASDISLPVLQESQSLPEPQVPSCPACRGLHRAHTCGRARRVAQT